MYLLTRWKWGKLIVEFSSAMLIGVMFGIGTTYLLRAVGVSHPKFSFLIGVVSGALSWQIMIGILGQPYEFNRESQNRRMRITRWIKNFVERGGETR